MFTNFEWNKKPTQDIVEKEKWRTNIAAAVGMILVNFYSGRDLVKVGKALLSPRTVD